MSNIQGKVIQIIGPVIDVSFPTEGMSNVNIYFNLIRLINRSYKKEFLI